MPISRYTFTEEGLKYSLLVFWEYEPASSESYEHFGFRGSNKTEAFTVVQLMNVFIFDKDGNEIPLTEEHEKIAQEYFKEEIIPSFHNPTVFD